MRTSSTTLMLLFTAARQSRSAWLLDGWQGRSKAEAASRATFRQRVERSTEQHSDGDPDNERRKKQLPCRVDKVILLLHIAQAYMVYPTRSLFIPLLITSLLHNAPHPSHQLPMLPCYRAAPSAGASSTTTKTYLWLPDLRAFAAADAIRAEP